MSYWITNWYHVDHHSNLDHRSNTYEFSADSEDEEEKVEEGEGIDQGSNLTGLHPETSTTPVDLDTPKTPTAEAVEGESPPPSSEAGKSPDDLTPDLIDHDIQQTIARRGKDKSRIYKAV